MNHRYTVPAPGLAVGSERVKGFETSLAAFWRGGYRSMAQGDLAKVCKVCKAAMDSGETSISMKAREAAVMISAHDLDHFIIPRVSARAPRRPAS